MVSIQKLLLRTDYILQFRFFLYLELVCASTDWKYDQWQLDDWYFALDPDHVEVMYIRSRGGSKTRDMTILAIFFALLGYKVIWYAASDDQLDQATEYANENPFCRKTIKNRWFPKFGRHIAVSCLTKRRAHSKRANKLFFDEEEDADEQLYKEALGTGVGALDWQIFHIGTTELGTPFEQNYKKLKPLNMVRETPVTKLTWTTLEKEVKFRYFGQPAWYIDQQLLCKWTVPEGAILDNIEIVTEEFKIETDTKFGIDWGAHDNVCGANERENGILEICFEGLFDFSHDPYSMIETLQGHAVMCEDGGYNYKKSYELKSEINAMGVSWKRETISECLLKARQYKKIRINPELCPNIYNDLISTGWSKNKPGYYHKSEHHPCHWWDAFLKCCIAEIYEVNYNFLSNKIDNRVKN